MKRYFLQRVLYAVWSIIVISSCGIAQVKSYKEDNNCKQQPLGLFRQITGSTLKLSPKYNNDLVFTKESDVQDNRWTLDPLDEVDPAYKFELIRNPSNSNKEKCGPIVDVVGKLISPTGKLFGFKEATYDIVSRKLNFITVERDGITYEVEAQFYPEYKFVNGTFEKGTVKLKASGDSLGTVLIVFPFTS